MRDNMPGSGPGNLELKGIRCLIFDFDGVIADTDTGRFEALNEVLAQRGVDLESTCSVEDLQGKSTERFLKDNFLSFSSPLIRDILSERRDLFFNHLEKYCIVYPGAVDTIRDLHGAGFQLALATSNDTHTINTLLEFVGIKQFFISILAREQTENGVTGLKDYGLVMKILNKKNRECIVIEDSPVGVMAAKNADLFCIAFERFKSDILSREADIIIHDYDELRRLFDL